MKFSLLQQKEKIAMSHLFSKENRPLLIDDDLSEIIQLEEPPLFALVLLCYIDPLKEAEIIEISLTPSTLDRIDGYTQLLPWIEQRTKERSMSYLKWKWNQKEKEKLYPLLEKRGWGRGIPFFKRYHFLVHHFTPRWLTESRPLGEYTILPFNTLSPSDWTKFAQLERQRYLSPTHSPIDVEGGIPLQREASLLLVRGEEFIGWSLTHLIDPETLRYSSLYILPEYRHHAPVLTLLAETILRQQRSSIAKSLFEINLQETKKSWQRFCDRKLAPSAERVDLILESCLQL